MMKFALPAIAGMLVLAACTAAPNGASSNAIASSPAPSGSPAPGASAAPNAPVAGASTVSLMVKGKAAIVDGVTFTPTDLIGKRLRMGVVAGEETPKDGGHANVTFLFAAGGKTMLPGWDVEAKDGVFSIQVFYVDPDTKAGTTYALTTNTTKVVSSTREAKDMHIKGHYEVEAFPNPGTTSVARPREAVTLDFDLVQPPMKP